jgi:transcriptional regulator with XRE-family HTH domain
VIHRNQKRASREQKCYHGLVKASRALRWARLTAGLTQRALAEKSGVPQSTVARIESGAIDPRVGTLTRLLHACSFDLEVEPRLGEGVDRSLIRQTLGKSPSQRMQQVREGARFLDLLKTARRVS